MTSYRIFILYSLFLSILGSLSLGCGSKEVEEKRLIVIHQVLDSASTRKMLKTSIRARYIQSDALENYSPKYVPLAKKLANLTKQVEIINREMEVVKKQLYTYVTSNFLKDSLQGIQPLTYQAYLLEGATEGIGKAYLLDSLLGAYLDKVPKHRDIQIDRKVYNPFYGLSQDKYLNSAEEEASDYVAYLFTGLSPLQSLLLIDTIQSIIQYNHDRILGILADAVSDHTDGFTKARVIVAPQSNTLEEGEEYKAEIFLGGIYAPWNDEVTILDFVIEGDDLGADFDNFIYGHSQRKFSFPVKGGSTEGEVKEWKGTITLSETYGEDTTIHIGKAYTVYSK